MEKIKKVKSPPPAMGCNFQFFLIPIQGQLKILFIQDNMATLDLLPHILCVIT